MNITRIAHPGRLGQPWVQEIVPGVFRVGTTFLGCYAVEDAGAYTFIDVGLPGYWPQIAGRHQLRDLIDQATDPPAASSASG